MKKLFTLIAAALFAVGVSAQTENLGFAVDQYPWNYETTGTRNVAITGEISVNANSQWGEYKLTNKPLDLTAYKGFKVEYSDYVLGTADAGGNQGFQLKIEGDPSSINTYSDLVADAKVLEGDFKGETGTISTFNLQAKAADAKVVIKKVTWVKRDGTTEDAAYGGKSWGVDVTGEQETVYPAALPMSITYKGQYGGLEMVGEDGSHQVYANDGENKDAYDYVIEFEEATTGPLMIELDGTDGNGFNWLNYDAGVTEIKFTISPETCGQRSGEGDAATFTAKNLAKIYMKAPSADATYPYTIKVKSVTRTKQGSGEGGEEATGGEATDTKFNVTKYTTLDGIDKKNCTTLYKYDETAKAVILTAYGAYQSSVKSLDDETKKGLGWVTYNSAGSSTVSSGWAATGVFQGSAYYGLLSSGSPSDRAAAINSSRAYTFTVTGCKAVSILGKSGKKTEREVILTVKESGSDANFAEKKDATNEIVTLTVDGMDASKTYEVTVTGNTSDNGHFYEIAFYLGSTTGIQQTIAPAKVIENNVIYNLAGQKVNENYKGIVIKNGKKYIQK